MADDSATSRLLVRGLLAPTRADLVLVADGRQAVRACAEASFDLLLFDLWMPELDGAAALAEIRAQGATAPALGISADAAPEDIDSTLAQGFALHLAKPLCREKLLSALDRIFPG